MSVSVRFASFFAVVLLLTGFWAAPLRAEDDEDSGPSAYTAATTQMETRLSAIEEQMRTLTGKVEQIDYATRRLDQTLQRLQSDYDARLGKLETAVAQTQAAPQPQPQPQPQAAPAAEAPAEAAPVPTPNGTLGNMKMRDGEVTGGSVSPKAPPLPKKPADYGLTPQELYDYAFGLLRQADYDQAEKSFKTFIDKNPKDKLIENAKYWYAETFYVRGRFSDAAVAFAAAFEQRPQGAKAPDSLLKLALSLAAIDKTEDACNTLSALKTKYPKAPATIRSRTDQERARLKCK